MSEFVALFSTLAIDPETVRLVIAGLLSVVGAFVAYQGYRGYERNGNRTLLFLTIGILLLTTIPFVIESGILLTSVLTLPQGTLISQLINVFGLILILYGFTRT